MASKRGIRRKACEGKKRYESAEDAQNAMRGARRRGHIVTPYRCKFCGGIHIGHVMHGGKKR